MNNTPNSARKEAQRQYDRIPEILRKNAPFCLWRYEVKNGRTNKVPYRVTGIKASSTDISTFSTFEEVIAVADKFDGIGTLPSKYMSAIDIDDCVVDGKLSDMAQDIVDTMKTYTEFSPSGTGLRLLFTAKDCGYDKDRYYINNQKIGLEVYMADFSEQFITLTGNVLCGDNIEERPKEIIAVLEKYMVRPSTVKSHAEAPGSYLSDESVIGKAKVCKQGEKFTALWEGSTDGYIITVKQTSPFVPYSHSGAAAISASADCSQMSIKTLPVMSRNARNGTFSTDSDIYLKDAQSVYPIPMAAFDSNRYLLNCNNGTLDLKAKTFYLHNPDDLLTKICAVDYIPSAHSQRFDAFIDEIMSHDSEKARFLQKSLGYGISGDTRYECLFLLYGELTRNGKGTLMESCLTAVGDYGRTVRPETIAQKQNTNSQAPSEDLARLAGIRFANISESSRGLVLNAAQVKSMTGNDSINARYLHENSFDFKPQFKLYINTNYLPVISDMTLFSSGRVVIIPFDRHFEEWEQDKSLKEEFSKPEVQSAILNWLGDGNYLL
nr:MAG TPA: Superfamily 3 helicase [Caudoviricetes sp.]